MIINKNHRGDEHIISFPIIFFLITVFLFSNLHLSLIIILYYIIFTTIYIYFAMPKFFR